MLTTILLAALPLAIALSAYSCARATRHNLNYWPMMRVMWSVVMAVYFGGFVNVLINQRVSPIPVRIGFNVIFLAGILYARWFMARRNRTPRLIDLGLDGSMTLTSMDTISRGVTLAASGANHGVLNAAQIADLEAGIAEWHRKQRWIADTRRELAERRARRGGGG